MYQSVIKLKQGLTQEKISSIHSLCDAAFDTHVGKLNNLSNNPMVLIYEDSNPVGAIGHGDVKIAKMGLIQHFESWEFIDVETGNETHSVLEVALEYYPEYNQGVIYGKN